MFRCSSILLIGLILTLGACRTSGVAINVHYEQISGLVADRRVIFQDNGVGVVKTIQYTREGHYIVELFVDKGSADVLTEHARFFIVEDPDGSGEKAVEIRLLEKNGRPLAHGANVIGAQGADPLSRKLQKEIESGLRVFKDALEKIGRDMQKFPESEEYRALKQSLDALAREMVKKEKAARESIQRQWLPRIQRELDDLRDRLKQYGRDKEVAPLDERVEHLRRI